MTKAFLLLLVVSSIVAGSSAIEPLRARAQDVSDGMDAEAHGLYAAGEVAFGEGRFANALSYFRQAYELSHRPQLLYNIGAAADRLRRDAEALAAFEQYLAESPTAANRAEVAARVLVLREALVTIEANTPTPDPEADVTPPEDAPPEDARETPAPVTPSPVTDSGPGPTPWIVLGIGGAVAVAGAVLVGLAAADVSAVENAPLGSSWSSVRDAYGRSEPMSVAGAVLLGVGGAAMVGGLAWGIAGAGGSRESGSASALELRIVPGGLDLRGAF